MSGIVRGWAQAELAALEGQGLRRRLEPIEGPQGPKVTVGGRTLINFSANDYLGLAADPRLAEAAAEAARRWGTGSGASRLVVGDGEAHRSLEAALAAWEGAEAALLFNSGWAANVGVISALLGPDDAVFSDALNHASIIDGCRLSRARIEVYPHLDVAALEAKLSASTARRKLVVTDTVFSMDGDVAPLAALARVAHAHGAALMVDDAHATGVLGGIAAVTSASGSSAGGTSASGLSTCEPPARGAEAGGQPACEQPAQGAEACEQPACGSGLPTATAATTAAPDLRMGTLGKALGSFGAFVCCDAPVRELLYNRARSLVFSTSLPPPACAAAQKAVELLQTEPERHDRLWRNIRHFAQGLQKLGHPARPQSAIFPVILGTPDRALSASAALRERGLLVKAIRPPTVPKGTSRLRFALSAGHTLEELDLALEALASL
jgi:8-amino-7-oxononanoate synthase